MTSLPRTDGPHHPGEAAKHGHKASTRGDKRVNDARQLGGRKVDLRQVTMPALHIYAPADHMIPPRTSRALDGKLGPSDYTELGLPGGDIDMFVSSESQGIVDWLGERDG